MTDETQTSEASGEQDDTGTPWEAWVKVSVALFALMATAWAIVFLRLGKFSIQVEVMAIPSLAFLGAYPVMVWGLLKSLFNPPPIRTERLLGFVLLMAVALVGTRPMIPTPQSTEDWRADHPYRLPFDGSWYTLAGGPNADRNIYATAAPALRWAYDFTVRRDGEKYRLDGKKLDDWYCYGKPVLSPVAGRVVDIENDVPDNAPGEYSSQSIFGNEVIIRAGDREYVFVSQLKRGSVEVVPGDDVEAGDPIGACGNSGHSVTATGTSEPHVHVHAQTSQKFPIAEGLPLRFSDYVADGESVDEGMPRGQSGQEATDGQTVSNRPR